MGSKKALVAFAMAVLMVGQLAAGATVLGEQHQGIPVSDGGRPTGLGSGHTNLHVLGIRSVPRSPDQNNLVLQLWFNCILFPLSGNSQRTAAGVNEDKAFDSARGYFIPPTLPPCRRKAC